MASNIARVDAIRSLGFASISGTYAALGTPFGHAMRVVRFINNTNGDLFFSFDGTTDNLFVPAGSFVLYDIASDDDFNDQFRISKGTQIYVKQSTAPTSGTAYLEAIYGRGE
jgi:hypothetical protein